MKSTGIAVLLAIGIATGLSAQVSVQSKEKAQPVEYASPMVLDLPLTVGATLARGSGVAVQSEDLSRFVCEGISIRMLHIEATKKHKGVGLKFVVRVYNDGSHDKKADVDVVILDGDTKVATASRRKIDAEEGKQRERVFLASVAGQLPETGTLKVTLTVHPN